jgi:putative zinc finger/helix-turn-helix YgiT family protein
MSSLEPQNGTGMRCPTCNVGQLHFQIVTEHFPYEDDGKEIMVVAEDVPVDVCDNPECKEQLSGPEAARIRHMAICRALGLLTPGEIRAVRDHLNLTQAEFARLTRLGEATICRWERGRLLQNPAMDRYLRLIASGEDNVRLLRRLQEPAQEIKPVPAASGINRMKGCFRRVKGDAAELQLAGSFQLN